MKEVDLDILENDELTVCFWNILFDANSPSLVKSQAERLPSITKTLQSIRSAVIGLAEVEGDNGQLLASNLKSQSKYFTQHGRPNNHIGLISEFNLTINHIEVDESCKAVIAQYKGVTIVVVHMTLVMYGDTIRKRQINSLLKQLNTDSPTIIMGDFNSMFWYGSRRLLRKSGFHSALKRTVLNRLPTEPTRKYRHILPQPLKIFGLFGFTLDDIYIRGIDVVESGLFEGESDHKGVWAKVRLYES